MGRLVLLCAIILAFGVMVSGCKGGDSKDTSRQTSKQVDTSKENAKSSAGVPKGNHGY